MKYKRACLYFHQGWTDIIMCLPMINYYSKIYDFVEVLLRDGAKPFIEFYIKDLPNVKPVYLNTDQGRFYGRILKCDVNSVEYIPETHDTSDRGHGMVKIPLNYELLFHAEHDSYREDELKNTWLHRWVLDNQTNTSIHFSEAFYVLYGLNFIERINNFSFQRDVLLENTRFEEFTHKFGENYVLYHDDEENHLRGGLHKSTKIKFDNIIENCTYINLNQATEVFFDYIKILQNAKEIHLIDSVWAALCYQIDAKYGLLSNKKITVHCQRNHHGLFLKPISLTNWKVV